jgi:hypothetical protein
VFVEIFIAILLMVVIAIMVLVLLQMRRDSLVLSNLLLEFRIHFDDAFVRRIMKKLNRGFRT